MAEFGIKATELSAPQGAGANVVAPTTANPLGALLGGIENVTEAFIKVKGAIDKNDAKAREEAIIGEYTNKKKRIEDALASGSLTAAQAVTRSQALFSESAAAFPAFQKNFQDVNKGFSGEAGIGVAEETAKAERTAQREKVTYAQSQGYYIPPNMPQEEVEKILKHVSNVRLADDEVRRTIQSNTEARARSDFDAKVLDKNNKSQAIQLLTSTTESFIDASGAVLGQITNDAKTGANGLNPELGKLKITQHFAKARLTLQAASQQHPELAGAYTSLFNEMEKISIAGLEPGADAKVLKDQYDTLVLKGKLKALEDPKVFAAFTANQLFTQNPAVLAATADGAIRSYTKLTGEGAKDPVIGNKDEQDVLDLTKQGLQNYNNGLVGNKDQAKKQATNSVNSVVEEVGSLNYFTDKRTPDQMKKTMNFLSSDEFGKYVSKEGGLDQTKALEAERAFRQGYASPLLKSVSERLSSPIPEPYATDLKKLGANTLSDVVTVTFDGNNIRFTPKGEAANNSALVRGAITPSLRNAEQVLNQLLRIGSHLNATQDYKGQFEQYKFDLLPQFFPVRPGTVVNGMKYTGKGEPMDYKDKANWQPVKKTNE